MYAVDDFLYNLIACKNLYIYKINVSRLCSLDIKIAVMPQNKRDVLTLLSATEEMVTDYADRPIITMSMAGTGVISRLCGKCLRQRLPL